MENNYDNRRYSEESFGDILIELNDILGYPPDMFLVALCLQEYHYICYSENVLIHKDRTNQEVLDVYFNVFFANLKSQCNDDKTLLQELKRNREAVMELNGTANYRGCFSSVFSIIDSKIKDLEKANITSLSNSNQSKTEQKR